MCNVTGRCRTPLAHKVSVLRAHCADGTAGIRPEVSVTWMSPLILDDLANRKHDRDPRDAGGRHSL